MLIWSFQCTFFSFCGEQEVSDCVVRFFGCPTAGPEVESSSKESVPKGESTMEILSKLLRSVLFVGFGLLLDVI